jgi:F0F1-type ATP synthase membrane subunit b/b'
LQWGKNAKLALKPTKAGFGIENGKITLKDSISVALPKDASMKMGGYMDLNKQLHLGGKMMVKGKALPFLIEGDVKQPKMSIDWRGVAQQIAKPLIDKAKDKIGNEINKKVDEINRIASEKAQQLRNAARQQAEQVRQAAKNLANEQRSKTDQAYTMAMDKAKKEADALVAAAGDPIKKKIARAAADKLLKSAEQKASAGRTEGYKLAEKTEAEGNAKADKIENEANEKATQIEEAAHKETEKLEKKTVSSLGK